MVAFLHTSPAPHKLLSLTSSSSFPLSFLYHARFLTFLFNPTAVDTRALQATLTPPTASPLLSLTSTSALADALELLGYGTIYHMREVNKNGHQKPWINALEAKYAGRGKVFGKEEWDDLLGNFAGTSDIPSAFFAKEFIAVYPDTYVIHTTRPFTSWSASMRRTLWAAQQNRLAPNANGTSIATDERLLRDVYWEMYWKNDFDATGEKRWQEHEAALEKLRQERELDPLTRGKWLQLELGKEGAWDELCKLLGKEVPKGHDGEVLEWPNHDDARPVVAGGGK